MGRLWQSPLLNRRLDRAASVWPSTAVPAAMDTLSSGVWSETLDMEKKAQQRWLEKRALEDIGGEVESDDEEMESYERMLKKMPAQNRVSLRTLQMRKGGLSRKIGSWSDKDADPPRTPSQDVQMIRSKMPPLQKPITGDLEGFNAHTHIPGYTGFFPGRKCKEYLLLKRADRQTGEHLNDLSMRYKIKFGLPNIESVMTSNQVKDNF